MGTKVRIYSLFILLACFTVQAGAAVDIDDLKRRALQYGGNSRTGTSSKIPKNLSSAVEAVAPQSRLVDNGEKELSEADSRYIAVHLKLANRHFLRKDYDKSNNEIDLVFTRNPAHAGARFMRAVISARLKDHDTAWYNVLIAKEKDTSNKKIDSFIEKLKTVSKQPSPPVWVKGIYRSVPVSACEKCCDVIEHILKSPTSQNIIEIVFDEYNSATNGAKVTIPVTFKFSTMPDVSEFKKHIQNACNLSLAAEKKEDKSLSYNFEITDLPLNSPKAVPVTDLREFVKGINEEIDVAIGDYEEYEPVKGVMRVKYKISVRNFSVLNDFLRVLSPYAQKIVLSNMKLSAVVGSSSIIWKTEVSVYYLISQ